MKLAKEWENKKGARDQTNLQSTIILILQKSIRVFKNNENEKIVNDKGNTIRLAPKDKVGVSTL